MTNIIGLEIINVFRFYEQTAPTDLARDIISIPYDERHSTRILAMTNPNIMIGTYLMLDKTQLYMPMRCLIVTSVLLSLRRLTTTPSLIYDIIGYHVGKPRPSYQQIYRVLEGPECDVFIYKYDIKMAL